MYTSLIFRPSFSQAHNQVFASRVSLCLSIRPPSQLGLSLLSVLSLSGSIHLSVSTHTLLLSSSVACMSLSVHFLLLTRVLFLRLVWCIDRPFQRSRSVADEVCSERIQKRLRRCRPWQAHEERYAHELLGHADTQPPVAFPLFSRSLSSFLPLVLPRVFILLGKEGVSATPCFPSPSLAANFWSSLHLSVWLPRKTERERRGSWIVPVWSFLLFFLPPRLNRVFVCLSITRGSLRAREVC